MDRKNLCLNGGSNLRLLLSERASQLLDQPGHLSNRRDTSQTLRVKVKGKGHPEQVLAMPVGLMRQFQVEQFWALLRVEETPKWKTTRHWLWRVKDIPHVAQESNPGCSGERRTCYHGATNNQDNLTAIRTFRHEQLIRHCELIVDPAMWPHHSTDHMSRSSWYHSFHLTQFKG